MIWATVSSLSCFCWLYRASPSLAARNIISLISVLTIWWCPCVESSLVLLERGYLLWLVRSLGKTLLAFALLHSVLQGQICLLSQVFLDFLPTFSFLAPIMKRTSFWGVSSRRSSENCSTWASSALVVGTQTWITTVILLWFWSFPAGERLSHIWKKIFGHLAVLEISNQNHRP